MDRAHNSGPMRPLRVAAPRGTQCAPPRLLPPERRTGGRLEPTAGCSSFGPNRPGALATSSLTFRAPFASWATIHARWTAAGASTSRTGPRGGEGKEIPHVTRRKASSDVDFQRRSFDGLWASAAAVSAANEAQDTCRVILRPITAFRSSQRPSPAFARTAFAIVEFVGSGPTC